MKPCPLCRGNENRPERTVNNYPLVRCRQCRFVYTDIPDEAIENFNSSFDEATAEKYQRSQSVVDELWFEGIAKRFTKKLGAGKVLDVGCGNGKLLREFKRLGWDCYGVDLSPWTERFAVEYGFRHWRGRIGDFREGEDSFDLVVSSSTLEHVSKPIRFLAETARFLKQGGIAYFCGMPNYNSAARLLEVATFSHNNPPWHVSFFTPKTARLTVAKTGIPWKSARIKTYGIPELHVLYEWLKFSKKNSRKMSEGVAKRISPVKNSLIRVVLCLHYYLGRPFNVGDKVEIFLTK